MDTSLIARICCGDASAMDFLANHWSPFVHAVDDVEDQPTTSRFRMGIYLRAAVLYSHPFYLAHLLQLRQVVINLTVMYADVVEWEKSDTPWKREYADHNRHCGMEMVIAIASICGGTEHALLISQEQRELCYSDHHNREGKAV
jgi:hypothetical protein